MSQVRSIPAVRIEADGAPLPASQALGLGSVRVQQELSAPTVCELTFHSPPGPPQGVADLTPGTSLRLSVEGSTTTLFAGEVTAVEYIYGPAGQHEVRVRAYDLLHRLRKRQTVRVHVQVSLQDLARELAADAGLQVAGDETGPLWRTLYQHRQSDLGVLVETAERCGLYLAVRDGTLHIFTLDGLGETVELALGTTLLEARIEVNGDPACTPCRRRGGMRKALRPTTGRLPPHAWADRCAQRPLPTRWEEAAHAIWWARHFRTTATPRRWRNQNWIGARLVKSPCGASPRATRACNPVPL